MKSLLLVAIACLFATSAHAVGCDLTVIACPDNAGASNDAGTLDCAGGQVLTLLATFQPAEAISDLVSADCIVDMCVEGDLTVSANFWDFQYANANALGGSQARPASGCTGYQNTFAPAGSGFAAAVAVRSLDMVRIGCIAYRPSPLAVVQNAKLFGLSLTIDSGTSAESGGGTAMGCYLQAGFVLNQLTPGTASGAPTTPLTLGSLALNTVGVNGAFIGVPTRRHSWGALKSMYR